MISPGELAAGKVSSTVSYKNQVEFQDFSGRNATHEVRNWDIS